MSSRSIPDEDRPTRSGGPHPGILALISLAIFLASLIMSAILTGGQTFVSPFSPTRQVAAFFQQNVAAMRVGGMLQFGSAVPLGIYAATVYARQLRLGVRVPGPAIGFFGGISAAVFLMLSGSVTWLLSRPEITTDGTLTHALAFLVFITGGVGFVVGIGLLMAGMAVPALILGFMPRWLAWTGLVIAALSELSFLSMAIEPLQFLLPIGRFGGLLWLAAAGFVLPRTRAAANQAPRAHAPRQSRMHGQGRTVR
ncbi:hypothetical protein [Arthrobacter bambusae]|uniref:hypothetical protein n=1 Tax=Arthrobacter bambusae TaxID=1338426 RepID=UPI0027828478|nr:hypothetical protein [Arthrobacter bambusae]MDQ0031790.1 hypothetical protein [Arthrobacter bambusae]MDQ0099932.1 hypothetical protein [Arthrobacter bambusae]